MNKSTNLVLVAIVLLILSVFAIPAFGAAGRDIEGGSIGPGSSSYDSSSGPPYSSSSGSIDTSPVYPQSAPPAAPAYPSESVPAQSAPAAVTGTAPGTVPQDSGVAAGSARNERSGAVFPSAPGSPPPRQSVPNVGAGASSQPTPEGLGSPIYPQPAPSAVGGPAYPPQSSAPAAVTGASPGMVRQDSGVAAGSAGSETGGAVFPSAPGSPPPRQSVPNVGPGASSQPTPEGLGSPIYPQPAPPYPAGSAVAPPAYPAPGGPSAPGNLNVQPVQPGSPSTTVPGSAYPSAPGSVSGGSQEQMPPTAPQSLPRY